MFLSNWLVMKVVAAVVTDGAVLFPTAGDLRLNLDSSNVMYLSGGSLGYASNIYIYKDDYAYKIGDSVSNIYVEEAATYKVAADICTFRYLTNSVNVTTAPSVVSQPYIDFDGSNRLFLSNISTGDTTHLTIDSNTYDIGTASNIYIEDTGTYEATIKTANNFIFSSNVVSNVSSGGGSGGGSSSNGYVWDFSSSSSLTDSNHSQTLSTNGNITYNSSEGAYEYPTNDDYCYLQYTIPTLTSNLYIEFEADVPENETSPLTLGNDNIEFYKAGNDYWRLRLPGPKLAAISSVNPSNTSYGKYSFLIVVYSGTQHVLYFYADGVKETFTSEIGNVPLHNGGVLLDTSFINSNRDVKIGVNKRTYASASDTDIEGYIKNIYIELEQLSGRTITDAIVSEDHFGSSPSIPTIDFDGYSKLFLSNIEDDTTTKLTFNSNTYDIGTASNIYIEDTGTYEAQIKSTNVFSFSSNVVSNVVSYPNSPILRLTYESSTLLGHINDIPTDGSVTISGSYTRSTSTYKIGSASGYYQRSSSNKHTISGLSYPTTGEITFSFWVYKPSGSYISSQQEVLIASSGYSSTNNSFQLLYNGSFGIFYVLRDGSGDFYAGKTDVTIPLDTWTHMAFCLKTLKFYMNGVQTDIDNSGIETLQPASSAGLSSGQSFMIAESNHTGDRHATFYIDEFQIYNYLLTDQQVADVYNQKYPYLITNIDFDGYSKLFLSNIEDDANTSLTFNSTTYDIGTASNIYIEDTGTYEAQIKSTNVFAFSSNVVSSVSFGGSPPTIDFDGSNKLFLSNIEDDATTKLLLNSNTYDIGTASNIYIEDTGTYEAQIKSTNVFAFSSNVVSNVSSGGSGGGSSSNGYVWDFSSSSSLTDSNHSQTLSTNGNITYNSSEGAYEYPTNDDYCYLHYTIPTLTSNIYFEFEADVPENETSPLTMGNDSLEFYKAGNDYWRLRLPGPKLAAISSVNPSNTSYGKYSFLIVVYSGTQHVLYFYADGVKETFTIEFGTITLYNGGVLLDTSFINSNRDVKIGVNKRTYASASDTDIEGYIKNIYIELEQLSGRTITDAIVSEDHFGTSSPPSIPTIDFDGSNRLFLSGIEDDATTSLTFNSTTYDIGTASNIYIEDTGTYEAQIKSTNVFSFSSNVVSSVSFGGSPPTIDFDDINTITASNLETNAHVTYFYGDKALACADNLDTHLINLSGSYNATVKGANTFTFTNSITADANRLYKYPPLGNVDQLTVSASAGVNSIWNIGSDEYRVNSSVASSGIAYPFGLFTNNVFSGSTTIDGVTCNTYFFTSSFSFDIVLTMPSAKTIRKYVLYPVDSGASSPYTPGSGGTLSVADSNKVPTDWTLSGSNDLSSWTTLDTVTNSPITSEGDVYSISSPNSYLYYKLSVTDNNGSLDGTQIGEWQLWGDKEQKSAIKNFTLENTGSTVNVHVEGFLLDEGWTATFENSNVYTLYGSGSLGTITLTSGIYDVNLIDDSGYKLFDTLTIITSTTYDFYVVVYPHKSDNEIVINEISSTSETLTSSMYTTHVTPYRSTANGLFNNDLSDSTHNDSAWFGYTLGAKFFSITPTNKVTNFSISSYQGIYAPGFRIQLGSQVLYEDTSTVSSSISIPFTRTINLASH